MIQTQFVWMVSKLSISSFAATISSTRTRRSFVKSLLRSLLRIFAIFKIFLSRWKVEHVILYRRTLLLVYLYTELLRFWQTLDGLVERLDWRCIKRLQEINTALQELQRIWTNILWILRQKNVIYGAVFSARCVTIATNGHLKILNQHEQTNLWSQVHFRLLVRYLNLS